MESNKKRMRSDNNLSYEQEIRSYYLKSKIQAGCGKSGSIVVVNFKNEDNIQIKEVYQIASGIYIDKDRIDLLEKKSALFDVIFNNKQNHIKRRKIDHKI